MTHWCLRRWFVPIPFLGLCQCSALQNSYTENWVTLLLLLLLLRVGEYLQGGRSGAEQQQQRPRRKCIWTFSSSLLFVVTRNILAMWCDAVLVFRARPPRPSGGGGGRVADGKSALSSLERDKKALLMSCQLKSDASRKKKNGGTHTHAPKHVSPLFFFSFCLFFLVWLSKTARQHKKTSGLNDLFLSSCC